MIKACVVCGTGFDARGPAKVCGELCRSSRRKTNSQAWRTANQDHVRERRTRWNAQNPEKAKAALDASRLKWAASNKERIKKAARARRERDPEAARAADKRYRDRNRKDPTPHDCAVCGSVFVKRHPRAKTCGADCSDVLRRTGQRSRSSAWAIANREKLRRLVIARREADPIGYRERHRDYCRTWSAANPEKAVAIREKYRITRAQIATRQVIAQMGLD